MKMEIKLETLKNQDGDVADPYESIEIRGSFAGASGRFVCTEGDCSGSDAFANGGTNDAAPVDITSVIEQNDDDEWMFPGADWSFVPNNPRSQVQRNEDETYLYFGIWASHPEEETGTYLANSFRRITGGGPFGGDVPTTLSGNAKFEGSAVGQYAIGEVGDRKAQEGIFTATAILNANFGTANVISGRITDFKDREKKFRSR